VRALGERLIASTATAITQRLISPHTQPGEEGCTAVTTAPAAVPSRAITTNPANPHAILPAVRPGRPTAMPVVTAATTQETRPRRNSGPSSGLRPSPPARAMAIVLAVQSTTVEIEAAMAMRVMFMLQRLVLPPLRGRPSQE
jgi:hypothetical protein